MRNNHWANMAEFGSAWGLSFLYWVYRVFGRWPLLALLYPVLAYFYLSNSVQRKASAEFLGKAWALGALKQKPGALASFRHFQAFSHAILDKVIAWNGGIRIKDVDFEGREPVAALLDQGKGLLLIGSHLGNVEICRVLSHERDKFGLQVLVHTKHAENFNRLIHRLNPQAHVSLTQVSDMNPGKASELSYRLSQGDCLMIAGDRTPLNGGRVVTVPFMGADADFAQGPWILAGLLGCPVYLVFCLFIDGRYKVIFEPFSEGVQLPRKAREKEIKALAERFAQRLQAQCMKAPLQWFNFYPFWQKHEQAAK